jgi:hypothetical protein
MDNRYGLPEAEVERVKRRDTACVYCHKKMVTPCAEAKREDWATIEHLNHLPPWNNPETIAICCQSCNASRGNKTILQWFQSEYCIQRDISAETVAKPVLDYIKKFEGFIEQDNKPQPAVSADAPMARG